MIMSELNDLTRLIWRNIIDGDVILVIVESPAKVKTIKEVSGQPIT